VGEELVAHSRLKGFRGEGGEGQFGSVRRVAA
jgi:hypothetical protein